MTAAPSPGASEVSALAFDRKIQPGAEPPATDTATLLTRARQGDSSSIDQLFRRFRPLLHRWAHGRLPPFARDGGDETEDVVQNSLVRALNRLGEFESRHEGAFFAYLRQIVLNEIRDRIRRVRRRPTRHELDPGLADEDPSPLERAIGQEVLDRYDRALEQLTEEQRQAVMLRIELDYSYPRVAEVLGKPSANAARLMVTRALLRVARTMNDVR
jgi:RNA polymerase sigma-70 factor, ECF subfamily